MGAHDPWHSQALQAQLDAVWPGMVVQIEPEVDSTNARLMSRARLGPLSPTLLVAEHQTQGRGRLGRTWLSSPQASLTFSIGVMMCPPSWAGLSLAVGVAVVEALIGPAAGVLGLKWPNDVWLRQPLAARRKCGGILVETSGAGGTSGPRACVVGVGLNVGQPDIASAQAETVAAAALDDVLPLRHPAEVLHRIAAPLLQALMQFDRQGLAPFLPRYASHDLLQGQAVHTSSTAAPAGVACGIDAHGALRLRVPSGEVVGVVSGEVSVRPVIC